MEIVQASTELENHVVLPIVARRDERREYEKFLTHSFALCSFPQRIRLNEFYHFSEYLPGMGRREFFINIFLTNVYHIATKDILPPKTISYVLLIPLRTSDFVEGPSANVSNVSA